MPTFIAQPFGTFRLGDFLTSALTQDRWTHFHAAIAFAKFSGVKHIAGPLAHFVQRGSVRLSVGIDAGGTSYEGLSALLDALAGRGELLVFHHPGRPTFHPKMYLFKNEAAAEVAIGSGNLTEGGLYTNYEASVHMALDLRTEADRLFLQEVEGVLQIWSTPKEGRCYVLDSAFLTRLVELGYVPTEEQAREAEERAYGLATAARKLEAQQAIFQSYSVPAAPAVRRDSPDLPEEAIEQEQEEETAIMPVVAVPGQSGTHDFFVMTLQRTDVGYGQTSKGTSPRSPEIFIPLAARDYDPDFWGWPNYFTDDPQNPGKKDRMGVKVRLGTEIIDVNMMTWPAKHDFRLRSQALRSGSAIGDILRLERSTGTGG